MAAELHREMMCAGPTFLDHHRLEIEPDSRCGIGKRALYDAHCSPLPTSWLPPVVMTGVVEESRPAMREYESQRE